jgi:hypothetical protein
MPSKSSSMAKFFLGYIKNFTIFNSLHGIGNYINKPKMMHYIFEEAFGLYSIT